MTRIGASQLILRGSTYNSSTLTEIITSVTECGLKRFPIFLHRQHTDGP